MREQVYLRNCIAENVILHMRNLCDFCTSRHDNDIKPGDLFDGYDTDPKYRDLRKLVGGLRAEYGNSDVGTVRWAFNKMLAHPTKERDTHFDYAPYLARVLPTLQRIIAELAQLRNRSV